MYSSDKAEVALWSSPISEGIGLSQNQQVAIHVVAAILYRDGEVLIFRRGPGMSGAGHWEFPGGKVEDGEERTSALKREIFEELGLQIEVEEKLGENIHQYPNKKIHLHFYWVPMPSTPFRLTEHDAFQSVKLDQLDVQILSEADRPIVEALKRDPRLKV